MSAFVMAIVHFFAWLWSGFVPHSVKANPVAALQPAAVSAEPAPTASPTGVAPVSAPAPPVPGTPEPSPVVNIERAGGWIWKGLVWAIATAAGWIGGHLSRNGSGYLVIILVVVFVSVALRFSWDHNHPFGVTVPAVPIAQTTPVLNCAAGAPLLNSIYDFEQANRTKIKAFQKAHGLDPDGVIGPVTFNAFVSANR